MRAEGARAGEGAADLGQRFQARGATHNSCVTNRAAAPCALYVPLLLLVLLTACSALNRPEPASVRLEGQRLSALLPEQEVVRVATYNVHMEKAATIARAMEQDADLAGADILLLQEIQTEGEDSPRKLAEILGWNYFYAPGYGVGESGSHGVAILTRFPMAKPEILELPRFHVAVNSARRVALSALVYGRSGTLHVYNVHLDARLNPGARKRQLAPVLTHAQTKRGAVVIGGDMNTSPFCFVGHLLPIPCGVQDNRLEALVRKRGFATPATGSGSTFKRLGMRLDALYTREVAVASIGVARQATVSDHLPLWADLTIRL